MVTSIINAIIGNNAAKSAASQEAAAGQAANAQQEAQYQQTRQDVAKQQQANTGYFNPYMTSGSSANNQLSYLLGLGGTDQSGGADGVAGSLAQPFTLAQFQESPDYQFTLQQGQQALARAQAAGGQYYSGGALKALTNYNQNAASTQYQTALGNYNTNQSNLYNRLSGVSQQGLSASGALGQLNSNLTSNQATAGTNMANQVSLGDYGIGNAQAAGTVGAATATTAGINQTQQGILNALSMSSGTGLGG